MELFALSINVDKIDKSRIYEGKKGRYLNVFGIVKDEEDDFGNNIRVMHQQTDDEREANDDPIWLGNGKTLERKNKKEAKPKPKAKPEPEEEDDDLPF